MLRMSCTCMWYYAGSLPLPSLSSAAAVVEEKESDRSVPDATPVTGEWCTLLA